MDVAGLLLPPPRQGVCGQGVLVGQGAEAERRVVRSSKLSEIASSAVYVQWWRVGLVQAALVCTYVVPAVRT